MRQASLQVDPNEGEERRGEVDPTLVVDWHVHPDEALVRQQIGALGAEAERRIDLLQQREHLRVVNFAPGITYSALNYLGPQS